MPWCRFFSLVCGVCSAFWIWIYRIHQIWKMCVYCLFNYPPPPSGTITRSSGPLKLSHSSCTLSCSLFKLFFPFHFDRLLSYKEHSTKCPYIKCTVRWFSGYSEANHTVRSFVTGSHSTWCCHEHPCCSRDVWGFLAHSKIELFVFLFLLIMCFWVVLNYKSSLHVHSGYKSVTRSRDLQIFAPVLCLVFNFLDWIDWRTDVFDFDVVQLTRFFLLLLML